MTISSVSSVSPVNAYTSSSSQEIRSAALANESAAKLAGQKAAGDDKLKAKFQDFVAGSFYKQMLKAMRDTQKKPAYFHGGQGEDIFQSQMDEYVTNDLARKHGSAVADPLFSVFARQNANV